MTSKAETPEQYLQELPDDRREAVSKLRAVIKENLPAGFEEQMSYGMLGYVVPHSLYPAGYHCTPKLPLPFINLASQKNAISLYHMGVYASPQISEWLVKEYERTGEKIDQGKGCIRFKKIDKIPYGLIGDLCKKISVAEWIALYENTYKKKK